MTTPHTDAAPLGVERTSPDVAAIEARAAAASRIDRYALPAEVLASLADNATLLAALRSLRAHVASEPERVAAAVAAEHAIALLSRTLGCESDTPEGIVTEALDYAAEQRERAEAADDAVARADAADARLAALAGAVRAEREATSAVHVAHNARVDARDAVTGHDYRAQTRLYAAERRYTDACISADGARKRLDALLSGAPADVVRAGVVDLGRRTTHGLKVWPEFFAAILDGRKTFEVRRCDDRTFAVGDALWLREWSQADGYTGREVARVIVYMVSGAPFLPEGVAVLGLAALAAAEGR